MYKYLDLSTQELSVKHLKYLQDVEDMNAILAIAEKQLECEVEVNDVCCISGIKRLAEQHKLTKADAAEVIERILNIRNEHLEENISDNTCVSMAFYWEWVNNIRDEIHDGVLTLAAAKEKLVNLGLSQECMAVAMGHVYGKCRADILESTGLTEDSYKEHLHALAEEVYNNLSKTK